jgi:hypothetical protein
MLRVVAIFTRCKTNEATKNLAEMTLIDETCARACLDHRDLRMTQQLLCLIDAPAQHILMWSFTGALLEGPCEVIDIKSSNVRKDPEFEIVADVSVDVFEHALQPRTRSSPRYGSRMLNEAE